MKNNYLHFLLIIILFNCCISKKTTGTGNMLEGENEKVAPQKCNEMIRNISYYWKLDSLANNGFRKVIRPYFSMCEIDNISYSQLVEMLGEPRSIRNSVDKIVISYFTYDALNMPDDIGPWGADTIFFVFEKKSGLLVEIGYGNIHY